MTNRRANASGPFAILLNETRPKLRVATVDVLDRFDAISAALVRERAGPQAGIEHYVPFCRLASDLPKLRPKITAIVGERKRAANAQKTAPKELPPIAERTTPPDAQKLDQGGVVLLEPSLGPKESFPPVPGNAPISEPLQAPPFSAEPSQNLAAGPVSPDAGAAVLAIGRGVPVLAAGGGGGGA